jgi:hypothetical protein
MAGSGSVLRVENRGALRPLESEQNPEAEYRRFRFKTPQPNPADPYASTAAQRVGASGNTLYIHKINGPGVVQVRFGVNNPWIDVAEGMVLRRAFTEIWIRDAYNYTLTIPIHVTELVFYTCFGEFISFPFKTHGFKPTPHVNNANLGAATVGGAGWVTLEDMINGAAGSKYEFAGDLTGNAFMLRVSQDSPTGAQLRYMVLPVPVYAIGDGYKLYPGEWLSVELDSKIGRMSGDKTSPSNRWAWCIAPFNAPALTCNVNYIIGTRNDLSDIDYGSDPTINSVRVLEMG